MESEICRTVRRIRVVSRKQSGRRGHVENATAVIFSYGRISLDFLHVIVATMRVCHIWPRRGEGRVISCRPCIEGKNVHKLWRNRAGTTACMVIVPESDRPQ